MSRHLSGVQQRFKEVVPHATYVHCYAHRFNLVVVDLVKTHGQVCDPFVTLQQLHNFLSTSVVHYRYVAIQNELHPGHQTRDIPSISETRWVC